MTTTAEKFRPALLALSEEDRAELAHELLDSLGASRSEADEIAFEEELDRRIEEMRSGQVVGVTKEEFLAQIDAHLASLGTAGNRP